MTFSFDPWIAGWVAALVVGGWLVLPRRRAVDPDSPPRRLFGPFTAELGAVVPTTDHGLGKVRQDLSTAGYYHPHSLHNFLAVRTVLAVVPAVGLLMAAVVAPKPLSLYLGVGAAAAAVLGFIVPRLWLTQAADRRAERFRRALPTFMDNMSLALSAGASLPEAMQVAGHSQRRSAPEVADEMALVRRQAEFRSLGYALEQFRRRLPVPEVGSLAFLLIQADQTGADPVKGLRELSDSYRTSARQRAEEQANRSNFWMLVPTVLCLFVATGIFMIAPHLLQLMADSRKVLEDLERSRQNLPGYFQSGQFGGPAAPRPAAPTRGL